MKPASSPLQQPIGLSKGQKSCFEVCSDAAERPPAENGLTFDTQKGDIIICERISFFLDETKSLTWTQDKASLKMDALVSSQVRNLESGNSKVTFGQNLNKKKINKAVSPILIKTI